MLSSLSCCYVHSTILLFIMSQFLCKHGASSGAACVWCPPELRWAWPNLVTLVPCHWQQVCVSHSLPEQLSSSLLLCCGAMGFCKTCWTSQRKQWFKFKSDHANSPVNMKNIWATDEKYLRDKWDMLGRGRNRDNVCWKCLHYQQPDKNLFTNTVSCHNIVGDSQKIYYWCSYYCFSVDWKFNTSD